MNKKLKTKVAMEYSCLTCLLFLSSFFNVIKQIFPDSPVSRSFSHIYRFCLIQPKFFVETFLSRALRHNANSFDTLYHLENRKRNFTKWFASEMWILNASPQVWNKSFTVPRVLYIRLLVNVSRSSYHFKLSVLVFNWKKVTL